MALFFIFLLVCSFSGETIMAVNEFKYLYFWGLGWGFHPNITKPKCLNFSPNSEVQQTRVNPRNLHSTVRPVLLPIPVLPASTLSSLRASLSRSPAWRRPRCTSGQLVAESPQCPRPCRHGAMTMSFTHPWPWPSLTHPCGEECRPRGVCLFKRAPTHPWWLFVTCWFSRGSNLRLH